MCCARLGLSDRDARSCIRLGFGRYTTRGRDYRCRESQSTRLPGLSRISPHEVGRLTLVRFFKADGTLDREVEAAPGQRLLDVAWAERQPLEGACEGVMACSTCHVIVDPADFAEAAGRERGGRGSARSRGACRPDFAARLPDHPDRGHEEPERPHSGRARPTGWGVSRRAAAGCRSAYPWHRGDPRRREARAGRGAPFPTAAVSRPGRERSRSWNLAAAACLNSLSVMARLKSASAAATGSGMLSSA